MGANAHHSIFDYRRALSQDEIFVLVGVLCLKFSKLSLASLPSRMGSKKTCFFIPNINQKDLVFLKDLIEAGLMRIIDRRYPLSDAAEALCYLEERHAQGKIVLTVEHSSATT
jgi:NADPH:quinone reductase-like Zn-dependent oxidoreductase